MMYLILLLFFLFSAGMVFYSYVLFPWILALCSNLKRYDKLVWENHENLPAVSVLISAFNEEKVLEAKLESIMESDYPEEKLEVIIGSDGSDDGTALIAERFAKKYPSLRFIDFKQRRGKPSVINDLVNEAKHPFIVLTDANVMFSPDALRHLMKNFRDPKTGLVGANILNESMKNEGISFQEMSYIARENRIKYHEGKCWGSMMGPFGGCYAMRKDLFLPVPANFLVDDFYISMSVLRKKYKCINELEAICYEDLPDDIYQEYKRKVRISAGNFQNLVVFSSMLLRPFSAAGFCFISHKVIRWMTPFLIIINTASLIGLSFYSKYFILLLIAELMLVFSPVFDKVFSRVGLNFRLLRFISYFSFMNLALLKGFFRYAAGVRSGVWSRTERTNANA
ncbi:MAG: glycosyltransferase family 2 protein [Bacteroidetes bacterium]|nr:MAG: glycosyltransferase family 2 protein [Bacteroidota bacterium]REK06954.1 MAG: glycosyltransferase family 2 protein [Bacteroidota bacterium]REK33698.1 MAG: glycosyltransferase family 2 protein [Bacteroidota bacterium]REK47225.1 MAG: glycosyltransferase family 2 protein [Bacteroidota bacterium]